MGGAMPAADGQVAAYPQAVVRRRWPERIVSWTRLLAGRIQDPMVGRDILIGIAAGGLMVLINGLLLVVPARLGHPTALDIRDYDLLAGPALWISRIGNTLTDVVARMDLLLQDDRPVAVPGQ